MLGSKHRLGVAALAIAGALFSVSAAHAGLIVQTGVVGSFNDDNVINNPCNGNATGPATTIQGCLQSNHDYLINFTSDENILFAAGGQAKIIAQDSDGFSELSVATAIGDTFQTLILNIEATADGSVTFTAQPGGATDTEALSKNGNNFFSISGIDFTSLSFTTTTPISEIDLAQDVKQVRIGINGVTPVPEPASLALFGTALVGLGVIRRRRKNV